MHLHRNEEEHFVVLAGTYRILIEDKVFDAPVGTSITCPSPKLHPHGIEPACNIVTSSSHFGRDGDVAVWQITDSEGASRAWSFDEGQAPRTAKPTCFRIGSKFRCIRSTPIAMESTSENDFECLASTGVNTPGTMLPT